MPMSTSSVSWQGKPPENKLELVRNCPEPRFQAGEEALRLGCFGAHRRLRHGGGAKGGGDAHLRHDGVDADRLKPALWQAEAAIGGHAGGVRPVRKPYRQAGPDLRIMNGHPVRGHLWRLDT